MPLTFSAVSRATVAAFKKKTRSCIVILGNLQHNSILGCQDLKIDINKALFI